ncbi:hypothetical protein KFE25_000819 [Diacronema lutheri]|uniref:KIF-binding protein n=1 Tax=Diacronema lutheri TaxID=2081491 RepID=A0A8J5XM77_DIALT|nr:hypothetical protein KFE25_000819 [Diacronema lutheri]
MGVDAFSTLVDEGGARAPAAAGLRRGFLNDEEPVHVPESAAALAERVRADLAECERLRAVKDDEAAPFDSRYEERRVLQRLLKALEQYGAGDAECAETARTPLGVVCSLLGNNFVDTEEAGAGSAPLGRAIEMLGSGPAELLHRVDALNHMGMLCSEREQPKQALAHLSEAKALYERASAPGASPLAPPDAACALPAAERLERLHTLTLFYLAQVHAHLGDALQSAIHAHATLRRQLHSAAAEFEPFEWCKNAMQLATYYATVGAYDIAEHCLHAADRVLGAIDLDACRDAAGVLTDKYLELRAGVHIAWGELLRAVLRAGRQGGARAHTPDAPSDAGGAPIRLSLDEERLTFRAALADLPPPSRECADCASLAGFDEARRVYRRALVRVLQAKAHYQLDGYVSDHYVCANLEAQLLGALVLYETDARRVLAMHRRRAAVLQPVLDAINPKAYHAIGRQMAFDLGTIYGDILDVRQLMLRDQPAERARAKLQPAVDATTRALYRFLDFFRDAQGEMPERVDAENEEVFLTAHFNIARAHGKLDDRESLAASLRAYEFIRAYADKHDVVCMRDELKMAREMAELLPTKVGKTKPRPS